MANHDDNLDRVRKTSNRFSMANLPSLMTKTHSHTSKNSSDKTYRSQSNTPIINSVHSFVNTENEAYSLMTTSQHTSLKSHNSNASSQMGGKNHPNKLARKAPGSKWGSQSKNSISNMSFGGDSISSTDGLIPSDSPIDGSSTLDSPYKTPHAAQNIMYHGEVQTAVGMFRKKTEYVVLTDKLLCRFPDIVKAAEAFPKIKSRRHSSTQRHGARSASITSIRSFTDAKTLRSNSSSHEADRKNEISLCKVVATYRVEDGRPFFITEVVFWDDFNNHPGSMQLMCGDPREADLWHTSIRAACQKAKLVEELQLPSRVVSYCASILGAAMDYDAASMKIFRAVRRPQIREKGEKKLKTVSSKSSMEDLKEGASSVCYLVFGINKLHVVSPDSPEKQDRAAKKQAGPNDLKAKKTSFGYVTLVSMDIMECDDILEIGFRLPLQAETIISLASCQAPEIGTLLFKSMLYLKPQWLDYTFLYSGPREVLDDSDVDLGFQEELGCFDRTLVAYCAAYGCRATNIRYTVDEVEDGPQFLLLPNAEGRPYSLYELLSIFRALRYNESFRSISFNDISLHSLYGMVDIHGTDHVAYTDRTRAEIANFFGLNPMGKSLLYQEVQALALKTMHTKRLDFTNCLPQVRVKDSWDDDIASRDPGCEIAAAYFPIRRAGLTRIDWVILNRIELGETDMEVISEALHERQSGFRAIEVAKCALNDRLLGLFLKKLERQNATLQCINIADNPGRLKLADFPGTMSMFTKIRKLNLSRATGTASDDPLVNESVLLTWRLEELVLTGVPINERTLDAISAYLHSDMSSQLRVLQLDQCNLTGSHVAILMRSMCPVPGTARDLKLHICQNRLEKGNSDIAAAIRDSLTPAHLTMRMVEYAKETGFRQLLEAVRRNTTLRSLDISKASLPSEQAEDETCFVLQRCFEENETLEELDISGEHAHLEDSKFGIGLNHALTGLRRNKSLMVLRLEYQNLDVQGADTLASVILGNDTLTHIYCEHNNVSLQGFTGIVNALEKNFSILYLPSMEADKADSIRAMRGRISEARTVVQKGAASTTKSAARKMGGVLGMGHHGKDKSPMPTLQDVERSVEIYEEGWRVQQERMHSLLLRNYQLAEGLITREEAERGVLRGDESVPERPQTVGSMSGILEGAMKNTTPKVELDNPVEYQVLSGDGSSGWESAAQPRCYNNGNGNGTGNGNGRTTPMQDDDGRKEYSFMSPSGMHGGNGIMSPQDHTPRPTEYRKVSGGGYEENSSRGEGGFVGFSPPRRQRGLSELTATMARFELGGDHSQGGSNSGSNRGSQDGYERTWNVDGNHEGKIGGY